MLFSSSSVEFDPARDIPDLSGKVILVTGGNAGLGAATVTALAQHHPAEIWLAARTRSTADTVVASIYKSLPDANIKILQMDLGSLSSVKSAAETVLAQVSCLDILILNAGVAFNPPGLTSDGYELQFGTNHVGHALLTQLLLPVLLKGGATSSGGRIVVVSSSAHKMASAGLDYSVLTTPHDSVSTMNRYACSKLANILMMRALAKHYPSITATAIHPGAVATTFMRNIAPQGAWYIPPLNLLAWMFFASPSKGAHNQLWAAVSPNVESGSFYDPVGKPSETSAQAKDGAASDRLWEWTEAQLALHGGLGWPRHDVLS